MDQWFNSKVPRWLGILKLLQCLKYNRLLSCNSLLYNLLYYELSKILFYKNRHILRTSLAWYVQQCAKKVMSDSPGLVDFVVWHVNSVLPNRQVKFSGGVQITEEL